MTSVLRASLAGLLLLLGLGLPHPLGAQIISPGKLSRAHADLEGLRRCTSCHELGTPGVSAALCRDCHTTLDRRIATRTGYHAELDRDCASCHQEHLGVEFSLVRMDTTRFDHGETGYVLEGAHQDVSCRACHAPERIADPAVRLYAAQHRVQGRTFLGLPTDCASCHQEDDPHADQFAGRACTDCHTAEGWEEAPGFDHAAARYPLTGEHARVACAECHTPLSGAPGAARYRPLPFGTCADCHDDPHAGAMQGRCETCHRTSGWEQVNRTTMERSFRHEGTDFRLVGVHAEADCASCHDPKATAQRTDLHIEFVAATLGRAYPRPRADACVACHQDTHAGAFADRPGGASCDGCHGEEHWVPAAWDLARHDRDVLFALEGAHRTVSCQACHRTAEGTLEFRPASTTCADCHVDDDPHGGQFSGRACDACHGSESFRIGAYDHSGTRFPLDGVHGDLTCAACHRTEPSPTGAALVRYAPLGVACRDCHGDDPL